MRVKLILVPRSCGDLRQHARLFYNIIWFEEAGGCNSEDFGEKALTSIMLMFNIKLEVEIAASLLLPLLLAYV